MTFPFAEGFDPTVGTNGTNLGTNVANSVTDKIVDAVRENPRITLDGIARLTGLSRRTVAREVESLKAEGRLKRIGSTRSGHWDVGG